MINIEDITNTIEDLEQKETTYNVCEKLSWLYIVRDHFNQDHAHDEQLEDEALVKTVPYMMGSEFKNAVSGKKIWELVNMMDDYLTTVKHNNLMEYNRMIERVRNLR